MKHYINRHESHERVREAVVAANPEERVWLSSVTSAPGCRVVTVEVTIVPASSARPDLVTRQEVWTVRRRADGTLAAKRSASYGGDLVQKISGA